MGFLNKLFKQREPNQPPPSNKMTEEDRTKALEDIQEAKTSFQESREMYKEVIDDSRKVLNRLDEMSEELKVGTAKTDELLMKIDSGLWFDANPA